MTWRKSTFSQGQYECVEVADGFPDAVPVRDSKAPHRPAIVMPANAWSAFIGAVKAGPLS
ncbi:DUF397 domain-containing protein [Streptomyces sp. NPDC020799]|uniref:DUF397 domain-containing protein n=1 Tax=Streptomyces sp. NPDC020799 TaxID=3365091 RepID=UPI003791F23C